MKFPRSIRWRLLLWLGFLLAALLTGFGVTAYQLQRMRLLGEVDARLEERLGLLSAELRGAGPGQRRPPREFPDEPAPPGGPGPGRRPPGRGQGPGGPEGWPGGGPEGSRARFEFPAEKVAALEEDGFYYALWNPDGRLQNRTAGLADLAPPPRGRGEGPLQVRNRGAFREVFLISGPGNVLMVGTSITPVVRGLRADLARLWIAGTGVLAIGLAGCWWITTRSLRPIAEISRSARRIAGGELSERISIDEPQNELGELAAVLNETFARLDDAFSQQVRFTADASHELRTPLALMISEAQATLARERGAAEYREALGHCHDAAQRMRALVAALLELTRLDAGGEPTTTAAEVDLAGQLGDAMARLAPLAAEAGCTLTADLQRAPVQANETRLGLVITNLITNAIHYNRPGGTVRLRTWTEAGSAVLAVEDTGCGISAQDLPRVFERFFRADASRSLAQGRVGLGLAICRAAVAAEGGSIGVVSEPGIGSTFTVRLPLRESPKGEGCSMQRPGGLNDAA
jgi:two-component system, OmpR family, sensor kinase